MSDNKNRDELERDELDLNEELNEELSEDIDELVVGDDEHAHDEHAHYADSKEERKARAKEEYRRREMERQRAVLTEREKQEARAAKAGDEPRRVERKKSKDKPGFFKRMAKRIRDTFGELRLVTWPNLKTVVKSTTVVLAVTGAFLLVTMIMDSGLGWLYGWFTGKL